ncbi:23S rRNA (guanosine(2251)-2'-O)-methyltransferase RlmB [Melioribacter sp. OK-6-Me]|uniref:23S rRNA (guanosine(2251)-2'-O)-methyltransferase RlmB n=1 Tax=unclassified Melioribacter TaxID=2627329 RepID=UPI003ED95DF5
MEIIYGRKPVLEAINAKEDIEVIYVAYGQHGEAINRIFTAAKKNNFKITQLSSKKFKQLAGNLNTQGVIAIKSIYKFLDYRELIDHSLKSKEPLILILDTLQDTHNLGAVLRTAECAGVDGVIITSINSAPVNETVAKISAGALSHLKISRVGNLMQPIKYLKEKGFWIVGADVSEKSVNYDTVDYSSPIALIIGNEERGIRRLVSEECDFLVKIPMKGKIDSLNVSVATGVILFEINRQRSVKRKD